MNAKFLLFTVASALFLAYSVVAQKQVVATEKAPKAIGPYSQAVVAGNLVFVSGQIGVYPETREMVSGNIREQTRQVLKNVAAVLEAAGCAMADVVSCTVYVLDIDDFTAMNNEYARHFPGEPPARATVEVSRIPKDALVEISCIALKRKEE